jgi:hypothetical protein
MYPMIRKTIPNPNIQIVKSPVIKNAFDAPDLRRTTVMAAPH